MQSRGNNDETSWGVVAEWYADHLKGDDTYHAKVIAPNLLRVLNPKKGTRVLDLACGEGILSRLISKAGAEVIGVDIAPELIEKAKAKGRNETYYVSSAEHLTCVDDHSCDAVVCVLALQNMEHVDRVLKECARVLRSTGRLIFVLNHPAFRIPKRSSWEFDEKKHVQFRRIDGYLSPAKEEMLAHPGKGSGSEITWSFHRSLQDWFKTLRKAGFVTLSLEEWISHKKSEKTARGHAEDRARKEFPLFLMIEAQPSEVLGQ